MGSLGQHLLESAFLLYLPKRLNGLIFAKVARVSHPELQSQSHVLDPSTQNELAGLEMPLANLKSEQ
jgi:hypothetical protein